MKLTRIPGVEPTVKQAFTFKRSTVELLLAYQQACVESVGGVDVVYRDLVEQMLLDFMAEDKAFQRYLKDQEKQGKKTRPVIADEDVSQEPAIVPSVTKNAEPGDSSGRTTTVSSASSSVAPNSASLTSSLGSVTAKPGITGSASTYA